MSQIAARGRFIWHINIFFNISLASSFISFIRNNNRSELITAPCLKTFSDRIPLYKLSVTTHFLWIYLTLSLSTRSNAYVKSMKYKYRPLHTWKFYVSWLNVKRLHIVHWFFPPPLISGFSLTPLRLCLQVYPSVICLCNWLSHLYDLVYRLFKSKHAIMFINSYGKQIRAKTGQFYLRGENLGLYHWNCHPIHMSLEARTLIF